MKEKLQDQVFTNALHLIDMLEGKDVVTYEAYRRLCSSDPIDKSAWDEIVRIIAGKIALPSYSMKNILNSLKSDIKTYDAIEESSVIIHDGEV